MRKHMKKNTPTPTTPSATADKTRKYCNHCGIALDAGGGCGICKPKKQATDKIAHQPSQRSGSASTPGHKHSYSCETGKCVECGKTYRVVLAEQRAERAEAQRDELLEACKMMLHRIETMPGCPRGLVYDCARDAIKKSEGK